VSNPQPPGSSKAAPIAIFGGMISIALVGLIVVLIYNCRRDEPYLDPDKIEYGQPGHVYPKTEHPLPPVAPSTPATQ
jgi:hypothetical protein